LHYTSRSVLLFFVFFFGVADLDPDQLDPYVYRPTGTGSLNHQAKKVRKTTNEKSMIQICNSAVRIRVSVQKCHGSTTLVGFFFTYVRHIDDVDDIAVAVLFLTVGEDFTITCVGNSVTFFLTFCCLLFAIFICFKFNNLCKCTYSGTGTDK
jgi:hypothetical protein